MLPTDQNSNGWWIEEAFVQAIKANTNAAYADHFQSDAPNGWPLVSVKAVLAEEHPSRIKVAGEPCEVYNVFLVAEAPLSQDGAAAATSATELDRLARQIRLIVPLVAETDAITQFVFFEVEPLTEGEKDIEEDAQETPTRRVEILSLEVIVIRAADAS